MFDLGAREVVHEFRCAGLDGPALAFELHVSFAMSRPTISPLCFGAVEIWPALLRPGLLSATPPPVPHFHKQMTCP